MSSLPPADLQLKAAKERERLHSSVEELRMCVRDTLDVERLTRKNLKWVGSAAAVVGLAAGYATAGLFVRRRNARNR